ncbi:hypothetical protein DZJ_15840 [Dickeya ananatis]
MTFPEIRYTFGGDEHLFAEIDEAMSLGAFFRGLAMTRALEQQALPGVLDICLANASFQVRFNPDLIAPQALLEQVRQTESQAQTMTVLDTRIIEIPVLYNDPWTHETLMRFRDRHQDPSATDLEYAARINGYQDVAAFIAAHSGTPWFVSMVGFVAGLPFMFQMAEQAQQLQVPKYLRPRTDTPQTVAGAWWLFRLHLLGTRSRRLPVIWCDASTDLRPGTAAGLFTIVDGVFPCGRHRAVQTNRSGPLRTRHAGGGSGQLQPAYSPGHV